MTLQYQIVNVRTVSRKPGLIYASVVDSQGQLCVNATLDYCVDWIKNEVAKAAEKRWPLSIVVGSAH